MFGPPAPAWAAMNGGGPGGAVSTAVRRRRGRGCRPPRSAKPRLMFLFAYRPSKQPPARCNPTVVRSYRMQQAIRSPAPSFDIDQFCGGGVGGRLRVP